LTQLINRTGRGKFRTGFIYCRDEDYPIIKRLIDPEKVKDEDKRQKLVTEIIPELDIDSLINIMRKIH
jgi:hypothetical protein